MCTSSYTVSSVNFLELNGISVGHGRTDVMSHSNMTGTEVFRFAIKPRCSSHTTWMRLVSMDLALCEGRLKGPADNHTRTILKRQDCSESIQQIAYINDGVFWIECEHDDLENNRCLGMRLVVNPACLEQSLRENGVESEEFVVQLARTVWRESVVTTDLDVTSHCDGATPARWNSDLPLRLHQRQTLWWMKLQESLFPCPFRYDGNIRITDEWYIDTEHECITNDPSPREAELRGGVCADPPGSGKTATAIALMMDGEHRSSHRLYVSRASLVIVPLNLTSQWVNEIDKFTKGTRVLTLLSARDLRTVDMNSICNDFDIVMTTFNFIRSCRAYLDVVDAALSYRPRSRASVMAWSRQRGHKEPVLEAVEWKRVIVDEIHQTFDASRDLRALQTFDPCRLWGLSGTLAIDSDGAQHLYILLAREKAHHPNLLSSLIRNAVSKHALPLAENMSTTLHEIRRVHVNERERQYVFDTTNDVLAVENEVRRLSFVDAMEGDESMEDALMRKQHRERTQLTSQLESTFHTIRVLERMCVELEHELEDSVHADGLRDTLQQTSKELRNVQQRRDDTMCRLEVLDRNKKKRGRCDSSSEIGTKMREIGRQLSSFPASEPIVMFVQWKTMMRGTRTFLRSMGDDRRVFTLDGNSHQRTSTLQEHLRGGVLLLCMEDSIAGLHLPHARNIIFAHAIVADVNTVTMLEQQAIARCVREGQTSQVTVHSFMVADSAEERHWTGTH